MSEIDLSIESGSVMSEHERQQYMGDDIDIEKSRSVERVGQRKMAKSQPVHSTDLVLSTSYRASVLLSF
jgi:hypothetical protein